jgi:hypothetical protein
MHSISNDALYRVKQIIGDRKSDPPIQPIIPVSRSTWWLGVKSGQFPAPIKLSERVTVWRGSDLLKLIEDLNDNG